MATRVASSTLTTGTGQVTSTFPAGIQAGDYLLAVFACKPFVNGFAAPAGWIVTGWKFGQANIAGGNDVGDTEVIILGRIATGTESGTVSCTPGSVPNNSWAQMHLFRKGTSTATWKVTCFAGADTAGGTAWACNIGDIPNTDDPEYAVNNGQAFPGIVTAGDLLFGAISTPTDVGAGAAFTAQTMVATGATISGPSEINEPVSTAGQDIGGTQWTNAVTAGSNTGTGFTALVCNATVGGTTTNQYGPTVMVRLREDLPLAPPTTVTASTTREDEVSITWSSVANAAKYEVYRDTVKIGQTTALSFFDTLDLGLGAPYANHNYQVTTGNAAGTYGTASTAVVGKSVVGPPTVSVSVQAQDTKIRVNFTEKPYAAAYRIYLDNALVHTIAEAAAPPHIILGLINGQSYVVGISTVHTGNESVKITRTVTPRVHPPWLNVDADGAVTGSNTTIDPTPATIRTIVGASTMNEALYKQFDEVMDKTKYVEFFYDNGSSRNSLLPLEELAALVPADRSVDTLTLAIFSEKGVGAQSGATLFRARLRRGNNATNTSYTFPMTADLAGSWVEMAYPVGDLGNLDTYNFPDLYLDINTSAGAGTTFNGYSLRVYGILVKFTTRLRVLGPVNLRTSVNRERAILYAGDPPPGGLAAQSSYFFILPNGNTFNSGGTPAANVGTPPGPSAVGGRGFVRDNRGQTSVDTGESFPAGLSLPRAPFNPVSTAPTSDGVITVLASVVGTVDTLLQVDSAAAQVVVAQSATEVNNEESFQGTEQLEQTITVPAGTTRSFAMLARQNGILSPPSMTAKRQATKVAVLQPTSLVSSSGVVAGTPANASKPLWAPRTTVIASEVQLTLNSTTARSHVEFLTPSPVSMVGKRLRFLYLSYRFALAVQAGTTTRMGILLFQVYQGTTLIKQVRNTDISFAYATDEPSGQSVFPDGNRPYIELTAAELASITDFSQLKVRVTAERDFGQSFTGKPDMTFVANGTYEAESGFARVAFARNASINGGQLYLANVLDSMDSQFGWEAPLGTAREMECVFHSMHPHNEADANDESQFHLDIYCDTLITANGLGGPRMVVMIGSKGSVQISVYTESSGQAINLASGGVAFLPADTARRPVSGDVYKVTTSATRQISVFRNGTLLLGPSVDAPQNATGTSVGAQGLNSLGWVRFTSLLVRNAGTQTNSIYALSAGLAYADPDQADSAESGTATAENAVVTQPTLVNGGADTVTLQVTENALVDILTTGVLPPDAIVAVTNLTGPVEFVQDDPATPDAFELDATGSIDLRVSFPTPTFVDKVLGEQRFRVRLSNT